MKKTASLLSRLRIGIPLLLVTGSAAIMALTGTGAQETPTSPWTEYTFHDSHFHLTNYVQEGIDIHTFLGMMGKTVGRVALFGIPLQQTWSWQNSGGSAPGYYLDSDAPLYYYSFTDAWIARTWLSLPEQERARFDPMITGFNPADMYAAEHIRRVLQAFPGVFTGIGEFSIHKEFVSSKIAGGPASLTDPAVDRIFDFAAESGLLTLIHNDIATPFQKPGTPNVYLEQLKSLFKRHPKTSIIWAHLGLGRIIQPIADFTGELGKMLDDPELSHVNFDISWDEAAKYIVATGESLNAMADLINRHPDRFLFGSDSLSPSDEKKYMKTYETYRPLWEALSDDARQKVRKGNYERVFDAAAAKVRAWEATHPAKF